MLDDTTIVAIATPPGRGGIGVVRLSGPLALRIAEALVPHTGEVTPRMARYGYLRDQHDARVDDALVTYFPAPHSYTGEDVVEIATHGAPVVLDWVVRAAVEHGATPARAGEFTERAFLRGRLDLTEAEAVRDLIDAETLEQARVAAEQMGGSIAAAVRPTKQALVELIALLEAGIDFAEDDLETTPAPVIAGRIGALLPSLQELLASFTHGRLLREGLRLAIVGRPNAGKSSLFNRLVERERAIVTAVPGTTRDVIAERIALDGVPVELLDTAGLRETTDEAERMGVERSRETIAEADAVLVVLDAANLEPPALDAALAEALRNRPVILAANKVDLLLAESTSPERVSAVDSVPAEATDLERLAAVNPDNTRSKRKVVRTSALTGEGIAELRRAILEIAGGSAHVSGSATLTNLRQREAVQRAVTALHRASEAVQTSTPDEMLLLDLYETLRALDELTGETTADDVLHLIFSTFCIGK